MGKRVNPEESTYSPVNEALAKKVAAFGRISSNGTTQKNIKEEITTKEVEVKEAVEIGECSGEQVETETLNCQVSEDLEEKPNKMKGILLTSTEDAELQRLLAELTGVLGVSCKISPMVRAFLTVLHHCEAELKHFGKELRGLKIPKNGDFLGVARFENELANLIVKAVKKAPPIRR